MGNFVWAHCPSVWDEGEISVIVNSKESWEKQEFGVSVEQQELIEAVLNTHPEFEQMDECSFIYHGDLESLLNVMNRPEFEHNKEFETFCKEICGA